MLFKKQRKRFKYQVEEVSLSEWELLWPKVTKANLLQSWEYGAAKEQGEGWRAHRFVISESSGKKLAIAQCLMRSWPIIGGIARINRGPLMLDVHHSEEVLRISIEIIKRLMVAIRDKRCWIIQLAPELPDSDFVKKELSYMGLHLINSIPWASGLIHLNEEESSLLMRINGKWRNCMRKGEKLGVKVEKVSVVGNNLKYLLENYKDLQHGRSFQGLSELMIRNLAAQTSKTWSFDLFLAYESGDMVKQEPIGQLVSIRHGNTATYLIGSANDKGRQMQANSVLLWHSILQAKEEGCSWFDIGGLNAATPKGIGDFKKGLNADSYSLVGEFRGYLLPWKKFS